ncbi:hypothetical protein HK099_007632 [Clydaea vesicula]|uniref:DNA primase large subunit C-terminal domain-containing protein n=1 Tax=Clydaea vesicula TaxID=447962 RepID=A0AAD5TYE4_9FUNG|nr:hypothetical protein HK099_007632 [Clydaea vesicula]
MTVEQQSVKIINDPRVVGYPNRVNLYTFPPPYQLNIEEFETFALDRLTILKAIETAMVRNTLKSKDNKGYNAHVLKTIKEHLPLGRNSLISKNESSIKRKEMKKIFFEERKKDHISHFILRLAFCQTEDLRNWFIKFETELFKIRLTEESPEDQEKLMKLADFGGEVINLATYNVSNPNEAVSHKNLQNVIKIYYQSDIKDSNEMNQIFYKVPFEKVIENVRQRNLIVHNGFVYVPTNLTNLLLINLFKEKLTLELTLLLKNLPMLDDSNFLVSPILISLSKQHLSSSKVLNFNNDSNTFSHGDIDGLAQKHFSPCMKNIHDKLRHNSHLRHFGRLQYGIGLPYEESLTFWRKAFKNMSDDQFQKGGHPYNIRHSYGLEGKRQNYSPYSCLKIITSNSPGSGDHHGCPFKHFSSENLRPLITEMVCSSSSYSSSSNQVQGNVSEVMNLAKAGHFQVACTRLFEFTHQKNGVLSETIDTIEHPNQYFELSFRGLENKKTDKIVNSSDENNVNQNDMSNIEKEILEMRNSEEMDVA